ncbi:MAG TPA: hypothetical protein VED01_02295 [Burkholderiales bacterium]|nr:hypothetical protein [Burkholderiales bacterium]
MIRQTCGVAVAFVVGTSCVWAQSSTAQKASTTQKGATTQGAVMQQKPAASATQQSSTNQQDCGKPNAQGVTVPCPGNKASNPTNPLAKPGGTGIGVSSGMPNANPLGTGSNISRGSGGQPTAEELAKKLKDENSKKSQAKTKEVGPEYFSREQQLKDLAKGSRGVDVPAAGAANQQGGKGLETKDVHGNTTSSSKTSADLAKDIAAGSTVSRDAGRNHVSRQEQQSDQKQKQHPQGGPKGSDAAKSHAFGEKAFIEHFLIVDRTWHPNGVMRTQTVRNSETKDATREWFNEKGQKTRTESVQAGIRQNTNHDPKKRPNPESTAGDHPTKTPEQMEAERKRQVTLPSDNQRRATERVTVSAETARQLGAGGNTSGNITPVDGDGTSTGPGKKPTRGIEKVDGRPGSGPGPDNPTTTSN